MGMTLDKIMQSHQGYTKEDVGNFRNPFREWSRMGNTESSTSRVIYGKAEKLEDNTNGGGYNEQQFGNEVQEFGENYRESSFDNMLDQIFKKISHLLTPVALVVCLAMLIFCVILACLLNRRRYLFRQSVIRGLENSRKNNDSHNNGQMEISNNKIPSSRSEKPAKSKESCIIELHRGKQEVSMKLPAALKLYMALKTVMTYVAYKAINQNREVKINASVNDKTTNLMKGTLNQGLMEISNKTYV